MSLLVHASVHDTDLRVTLYNLYFSEIVVSPGVFVNSRFCCTMDPNTGYGDIDTQICEAKDIEGSKEWRISEALLPDAIVEAIHQQKYQDKDGPYELQRVNDL